MAVTYEEALAAYERLPANEQVEIDQLASLLESNVKQRRVNANGHPAMFGNKQAIEVLYALGLFLARRNHDEL